MPLILDFQQPIGPSVDMTDKSPLDFFKMMVTEDMLDHIVEQTNIYAEQYIDTTPLPPHSCIHGWNKEVHNRAELKKALAMIITMGLVNYPLIENYWATYWPYAAPSFLRYYTIATACECTCTCNRKNRHNTKNSIVIHEIYQHKPIIL